MGGLLVAIEWEWAKEEFSLGWEDFNGNPLPLLPVGSTVKVTDNEGMYWILKVREYISRFSEKGTLFIYIQCDFISVE